MGQTAKIVIHPSFEIGEISPRLFSTFLEPIGTMVNGTSTSPTMSAMTSICSGQRRSEPNRCTLST